MSTLRVRAFLAVLLVTLPAAALLLWRWAAPQSIDRRAALLEVLPSESIQRSPGATDLVNRLIKKHVLLLQRHSLIMQVMQNPEIRHERWTSDKKQNAVDKLLAAVRVRAIPETNIVELMVDPHAAGDESATLAEAIVNQHLENQKELMQNALLERSIMLNNLKQRYQFRKDELDRVIREKAVRLSIDGMGAPGRVSAKELELQNLTQLAFELERKQAEQAATNAPATTEPSRSLDAQIQQVHERLNATKADLGDLTNAMNQYLAIKDDQQTTRELLKQVNDELERISQQSNATPSEVRWLCKPEHG